jgi:hypothetical protein
MYTLANRQKSEGSQTEQISKFKFQQGCLLYA